MREMHSSCCRMKPNQTRDFSFFTFLSILWVEGEGLVSSEHGGVIGAVICPAEWVSPSVELGLSDHVVVVSFSFDDSVVDVSVVSLGWSLRLFVLQESLIRDRSVLDSFSGHLHQN